MKRKYFIISDIHGYYDEMILALNQKRYDSNNSMNHLIVIGDMFDRGTKSKEVLEYLYHLSIEGKATVILGNHDNFLIELLEEKYLKAIFNIRHNGTGKTLMSLTGIKDIGIDELDDIKMKIMKSYPYLKAWLKSLPLYLELGKYIFVHGGIDGNKKDWKKGLAREFIWSRQIDLEPVNGKIMVVGHHRTATIRYPNADYKTLYTLKPEAFDILYKENKIFIDSFVENSHMINVLVIEI